MHRGKNYGKQLIEYCDNFLKKLNIDYVHCQAENEISKNIFIKNNYLINKTFNSNIGEITLMTKLL
jgi:predicted acetyltransferase